MTDEIHRHKFVITLGGDDDRTFSEGRKTIPLGEVLLAREPNVPADASFWEWARNCWREDHGKPADAPLCAGARIVVDENGEGYLTIDESLPDGVWVVSHPDKSYRLTGVTGPVRVESKAEKAEDIEVSPVALTFEGRE